MGLILKQGESFNVKEVKSGVSPKGEWMLLVAVDEKGKNRSSLFVDNIAECGFKAGDENLRARLDEITSINMWQKKVEGKGWQVNTSINVKVSKVGDAVFADGSTSNGFTEATFVELPF